MAKFYIQSGQIRFVVNAVDAEGAALWVMNRTINAGADLQETGMGADEAGTVDCLIAGTDCLDAELHVSEIGFGRGEVAVFDTGRLFQQWQQLLRAMDRLLDQLEG